MASRLELSGFRVRAEVGDSAYPEVPALRGTLGAQTYLVEVYYALDLRRVRSWVAYCSSCTKDTRFAICLPASSRIGGDEQQRLKELGVGLYFADSDTATEILPAHDLALHMTLPPIDGYPLRLRRRLSGSYLKFERGDWPESFEDACQALESAAREYLMDGVNSRRIQFAGRRRPPPVASIARQPLGGLAKLFADITAKNLADSRVAQVLAEVNPDRITVAHYKGDLRRDRRLRENVGPHMHRIVGALKLLLGVK